jgi:hypothetical protein
MDHVTFTGSVKGSTTTAAVIIIICPVAEISTSTRASAFMLARAVSS